MNRFIESVERGQVTLFPDRLGDWIGEDNPVQEKWFGLFEQFGLVL